MIEYINKRLNEWASWCKRRDDGGLGYPSQSNYCSAVQVHGGPSAGAITQFAAEEEIELVMVRIRNESPAKWDVADWVYLKGSFTMSRIASELNCCERTVHYRLHALHSAVMDALYDIEIESQDRADAFRTLTSAVKEAQKAVEHTSKVIVRRVSAKVLQPA